MRPGQSEHQTPNNNIEHVEFQDIRHLKQILSKGPSKDLSPQPCEGKAARNFTDARLRKTSYGKSQHTSNGMDMFELKRQCVKQKQTCTGQLVRLNFLPFYGRWKSLKYAAFVTFSGVAGHVDGRGGSRCPTPSQCGTDCHTHRRSRNSCRSPCDQSDPSGRYNEGSKCMIMCVYKNLSVTNICQDRAGLTFTMCMYTMCMYT
jgi:hypothetical protein